MCYTNTGVVDDLLVYKISDEHFYLVINAGNIEKDFQWMLDNKQLFDVEITNLSDVKYCELGTELEIVIRDKPLKAMVISKKFYKRNYKK